ncbi:hypothetical protein C2G38_2231860 [Gigaspora rosea]|uniref:Uncharacterized protein n=1 Tax=Gigaspora rosea TaxID=44941 RepID=A0A397TSJ4_9GLOM|nr:hypothetical protein C2G38_2231860 [Gigaspora rosea]
MNDTIYSGETKSGAVNEHQRKIDIRIVCINQDFELSHVECAKVPTLYFSDRVVKGSTIFGLEGQIIRIDLLDNGLYFSLEGAQFTFPAQLSNIECLRDAFQTLYFFKKKIVQKAKMFSEQKNNSYSRIFHNYSETQAKAKHFKAC